MGRLRRPSGAPAPPRIARLLLRLLPSSAREFVVGDLEEEYRERRLQQEGPFGAGLWFWRQTIASLLAFRGFRTSNRDEAEPDGDPGSSSIGFRPVGGPGRAGTRWLDGFAHDLRLSARSLIRRPGFTVLAVLTLGLGIGTATAMFAALDAAFLRPLPFGDPDRLLQVWMGNRETGWTTNPFTIRDFHDWREATRVVDLAAYGGTGLNVSTGERTEWRIGIQASANLLSVLGIEPRLGRGFAPEEERPDAPRTVMLTSGLWEEGYGSDPQVLGRTLMLDGEPYTIIGVLPPGITLPHYRADLWIPLHVRGDEPRTGHSFWGLARYPEGASLEKARADLQAAARATAATDPAQIFPDATVVPYADVISGPDPGQISLAFGAAVLFVLLIACANIANLLLARGIDRAHEIAVRNAMGGGRRRVLGQLLTEASLLALLGGIAGVALAYSGIELLRRYIVPPDELQVTLDHRVLLACLILTAVSALLSGLVPAVVSSRVDLRSRLQAGTRGVLGSGRRRLGQTLVVAQVAMVLALLVSAGLITRSLLVLSKTELGFRTEGLLTFQVSPPASRYPDAEALERFYVDAAGTRLRRAGGQGGCPHR